MQELSACIYSYFKRELRFKLLLTFGNRSRIQKIRTLFQTFKPFDQVAIFQAAWKDQSKFGDLVRRAIVNDEDTEISEEEWEKELYESPIS